MLAAELGLQLVLPAAKTTTEDLCHTSLRLAAWSLHRASRAIRNTSGACLKAREGVQRSNGVIRSGLAETSLFLLLSNNLSRGKARRWNGGPELGAEVMQSRAQ